MSDIRQTSEWASYLSSTGWRFIKIGQNYVYIRKLPIFGTYLKIPRPTLPIDLERIDQLAHEHRALLVKIAPKILEDTSNARLIHQKLLDAGFLKDYWTPTITKTAILDLTKKEDELLKSFHRKTRYHINLAKRLGVKIIRSVNIKLCYQLYLETAKRKGFHPASFNDISSLFQTFKRSKKALLLFALAPDSQPLATLLILFNSKDKEAVPYVAGISNIRIKLRASYLLHHQAMILAKKMGYKKFDFDGILDKRYKVSKIMVGSSFFKRGFRGKEISFIGSYIKIYNPIFRPLFSLIIRLTR